MLDFYQTQHTVRWWRQNQSVVRQCQIADRTLYTLITSVRCLTKPLLINVLSRHATACPTTSVFKMASLNSKRYKMRHFSREMLNKNAWEEDIVSAVQRLVPRLACSEGCRTTRNCNLRHFSGRIGRSVVIHCGWLGSKHQLTNRGRISRSRLWTKRVSKNHHCTCGGTGDSKYYLFEGEKKTTTHYWIPQKATLLSGVLPPILFLSSLSSLLVTSSGHMLYNFFFSSELLIFSTRSRKNGERSTLQTSYPLPVPNDKTFCRC